jgi:hypothetical protein
LWSESQIEAEAEQLAGTDKQYLTPKTAGFNISFIKNDSPPITISCEIAKSYQDQTIGLQKYNSLKHDKGMIFTYSSPQSLSFHMGSVSFPIDIIFVDLNDKIVKICHNCRPNSREIYSCNNAVKVVETVGNFCIFHNINEGDKIKG